MDVLKGVRFGFGRRLPLILQTEAAECGLICLAMVAGYHGQGADIKDLRRRFSLSLKGVNLVRLIDIAAHMGLQCRALRLEMEQLRNLDFPCVLHWDLNHFVVLKRATSSDVVVHDPAFGERRLRYAEVSKHFTGVALEIVPGADFKKQEMPPAITLRQLTGPIHQLKRGLAQILLLSFALQIMLLLTPLYLQWTVDQVLVSADHNLLVVLGVGFLLTLLFQVGIGFLRGWLVMYVATTLVVQWMTNVFAHLLKLPMEYFEKRHLGDVVSRMYSARAIQQTLSTSFVEAIVDGLMATATLAMMLAYSWKLAFVTLAAIAVYLGLRAIAFRPFRTATEQQIGCAAKQQSHLLESIRGIQSVKIAGRENTRRIEQLNLMVDTTNRDLRLTRLNLCFASTSQLVFGSERVIVIWVGALLALDNAFSAGMLIAYIAYKDQFAQRVSGLIDKWIEFRMLRLHGERLADIVLTPPEMEEQVYIEVSPPASMRIDVDVSFRYAEGEPWVLKDCKFSVEEGESVAIVGPSGCGKTTLIKVILGLLTPTEGKILVGGQEISQLGTVNYRSMVGTVMQDDQLFAGSVADNISFFDSVFDQARIEEVARIAAVHEEIVAMPMRYHSLIGDMGTTLSGGQKQRVILARALYRQPKILFLDEATSHLDVRKEQLVNEAIRELKVTKVIVAHRPETIASADRILVMRDGRIAEEAQPHASRQSGYAAV